MDSPPDPLGPGDPVLDGAPLKPPGGLGKGLAGILEDSLNEVDDLGGGLQQLLGGRATTVPPRVRQFVIETALDTIAESFDAEAVVVVRREPDSAPAAVSTRFPASWDDASAARFELFGQLWNMLDEARPPSAVEGDPVPANRTRSGANGGSANGGSANGGSANGGSANGGSAARAVANGGSAGHAVSHEDSMMGQAEPAVWTRTLGLGDHWLWLACRQLDGRRLAAAVVRSRPLDEREQRSLRRLIASVSAAVSDPMGSGVTVGSVSLIVDGTTTRAEVSVRADEAGSVAFGEAATAEQAVAEAAATLLGTSVKVTFAGRTDLDGVVVSIVVLEDEHGAPLIGLSTSESEPLSGVVEAVFSAVAG